MQHLPVVFPAEIALSNMTVMFCIQDYANNSRLSVSPGSDEGGGGGASGSGSGAGPSASSYHQAMELMRQLEEDRRARCVRCSSPSPPRPLILSLADSSLICHATDWRWGEIQMTDH